MPKLLVQNFKSIREAELDCARVNVIIGEPNTGKSNLLEAIGLLSLAYYAEGYEDVRSFVRHLKLADLFHENNVNQPIHVQHGEDTLTLERSSPTGLKLSYGEEHVLTLEENYLSRYKKPEPLSKYKFYRFKPATSYPRSQGGTLRPPSGDNLFTLLYEDKELREFTRDLFKKFGLSIVLKPHEATIELQRQIEEGVVVSTPYALASEGLQMLVFHYASIHTSKGSVLIFEEPESRTFPFYVNFLAERIAKYSDENTFYISTHNPYLLQTLIEKTSAAQLAVFVAYIEQGKTKLSKLTLDQLESILDQGPATFFNLEELIKP